jgi:hypothetical protein
LGGENLAIPQFLVFNYSAKTILSGHFYENKKRTTSALDTLAIVAATRVVIPSQGAGAVVYRSNAKKTTASARRVPPAQNAGRT